MLDEIKDVLFGNAASGAGALNFGKIDTMFARKLANERR